MNYSETLDFITEVDWKGSRLGLERMRELLDKLGNPQKSLNFIHVAGTNGKGSVCAMLSSIFVAAGYKTGLCISPHLFSYNERMQFNGRNASDKDMCLAAEKVKSVIETMEDSPTEFERVLAMAFCFFVAKECDIVVLEVGLGGRLDATNIIEPPLLTIITHIALDHTGILGDTIEKIATEKAGIIKSGTTVVMMGQSPEGEAPVRRICKELDVPIYTSSEENVRLIKADFDGQNIDCMAHEDVECLNNIYLSLLGDYQLSNVSLVLEAVGVFNSIIAKNRLEIEKTVKARNNSKKENKDYSYSIIEKEKSKITSEKANTEERNNCYSDIEKEKICKCNLNIILEDSIRKGLSEVRWPGRFEVIKKSPLVIVDGAHNPDGASELASSIERYLPGKKIIFVMSVMRDKDYLSIIRTLSPYADSFIATAPDYDRAMPPEELAEVIRGEVRVPVSHEDTVAKAMEKGIALAVASKERGIEKPVIAFGSLYQVGEIIVD